MSMFDRGIACLATVLTTTALAACTSYSRSAVQTSASKPTVSYEYGSDDALIDATRKAESFCEQYRAWPSAVDFDKRNGEHHATFACDQPRVIASAPTTVVVPSPQPPLAYPYRDDRSLVEAMSQAQRYCLGLNANARSTRVTNNADGSRTVTFECERL
jgi:hypothetical protein